MRYGVQIARRGWLEKKDVINTLAVEKLLATLRPKPGASSGRKQEPGADARKKRKSRKSS